MDNSCNFNVDVYRQVINFIRRDFPIISFENGSSSNGVILRLDVDYDLEWAACLAEINESMNVHATFFILVDSTMYNIYDKRSRDALRLIEKMGQSIGLHFQMDDDYLDLERVECNYRSIKNIVPNVKRVIAWHNPEKSIGEYNRIAESAGYICTYSEPYFGPDCYISDSNLVRKPQDILEFLARNSKSVVQVLFHPVHWVLGGNSIEEILKKAFSYKIKQIVSVMRKNHVWQKDNFGESIECELTSCSWYC